MHDSPPAEQLKQDLDLIREIDDLDCELPWGLGDWIEERLLSLESGSPLSDEDRAKCARILAYAERQSLD